MPTRLEHTTEERHAYLTGAQLGARWGQWNGTLVSPKIESLCYQGQRLGPLADLHREGFREGLAVWLAERKEIKIMPSSKTLKKATPSSNVTANKKVTRKAPPTKATQKKTKKTDYINEVMFSGNLGKEPEASYTSSGKGLVKASFAVWLPGSKDGDNTQWFDLVCWLADDLDSFEDDPVAGPFYQMSKGDKVTVFGQLTRREYNDRYYYGITVKGIRYTDPGDAPEQDDDDDDEEGEKSPF